MEIRIITTLEEAYAILRIRNKNVKYLTNNQNILTNELQKEWWRSIDKNLTVPLVITYKHSNHTETAVGYGIVQTYNKYCTLTGVLDSDFRGRGFGRKLFTELMNISLTKRSIIILEVLESNYKAISLYKSLGFEVINSRCNVKTMIYYDTII